MSGWSPLRLQHLEFGKRFGELHIHPAARHAVDNPAVHMAVWDYYPETRDPRPTRDPRDREGRQTFSLNIPLTVTRFYIADIFSDQIDRSLLGNFKDQTLADRIRR